jgi:hypothetical protein
LRTSRKEEYGPVSEVNLSYAAPCGLYCGVCRIRQATQEEDLAYLRRLARVYGRRFPEMAALPPEKLLCDGCLSARRFPFCQECSIRDCAQEKGYQGCHQCPDFPCSLVDEFPMPAGRKVMLRAVPYRGAHGTTQWILAEEARYLCSECGQKLFRGAKQCPHCRALVDVD